MLTNIWDRDMLKMVVVPALLGIVVGSQVSMDDFWSVANPTLNFIQPNITGLISLVLIVAIVFLNKKNLFKTSLASMIYIQVLTITYLVSSLQSLSTTWTAFTSAPTWMLQATATYLFIALTMHTIAYPPVTKNQVYSFLKMKSIFKTLGVTIGTGILYTILSIPVYLLGFVQEELSMEFTMFLQIYMQAAYMIVAFIFLAGNIIIAKREVSKTKGGLLGDLAGTLALFLVPMFAFAIYSTPLSSTLWILTTIPLVYLTIIFTASAAATFLEGKDVSRGYLKAFSEKLKNHKEILQKGLSATGVINVTSIAGYLISILLIWIHPVMIIPAGIAMLASVHLSTRLAFAILYGKVA